MPASATSDMSFTCPIPELCVHDERKFSVNSEFPQYVGAKKRTCVFIEVLTCLDCDVCTHVQLTGMECGGQ